MLSFGVSTVRAFFMKKEFADEMAAMALDKESGNE